jgi:hypothetical protein
VLVTIFSGLLLTRGWVPDAGEEGTDKGLGSSKPSSYYTYAALPRKLVFRRRHLTIRSTRRRDLVMLCQRGTMDLVVG